MNTATELAKAVILGAVRQANGGADFFNSNWNPDAHLELTLTIKDVRNAVRSLPGGNFAVKDQLDPTYDAQDQRWSNFLRRLDA